MLTIIHGSDTAASRNYFLQEKQRFAKGVLLRGSLIDLTDLCQLLEGGGLFGDNKQIFIEQFLSERKKSAERDAIISYLKKQGETHEIFLWEGKEFDLRTLAPFKGAVIKTYKLSSTLFAFLDAVKPNNGKQLAQLFHKTLQTTEAEMIFFMLVRQLRILIVLSDKGGENISETLRLAPWQKSKLETQAGLFGENYLKQLYLRLFQIELGQKTGMLSSSLVCAVDFFLLGI